MGWFEMWEFLNAENMISQERFALYQLYFDIFLCKHKNEEWRWHKRIRTYSDIFILRYGVPGMMIDFITNPVLNVRLFEQITFIYWQFLLALNSTYQLCFTIQKSYTISDGKFLLISLLESCSYDMNMSLNSDFYTSKHIKKTSESDFD